jgi:phosphatidylserine/phosphatidylglycerophosphate/cardiolipin synthase-like enzyme
MIQKIGKRIFLAAAFCGILVVCGLLTYVIECSQSSEHYLKNELLDAEGRIAKVFFSPDDTIKETLIDLIAAEKKQILVAIYTFTQKDIAQALVQAHERGVRVEVVADRGYGSDRYSKVPLLANHKIPIWIYQTDQDERKSSLMHHKFCIFADNIQHKSLLWTGSYNFTQRATQRNQENVLIVDDQAIIKRFTEQFELLKTRSLLISGQPGIAYQKPSSQISSTSFLRTIKQFFRKMHLPF